MANRRHGSGNRTYSHSPMTVSPWQGGLPPNMGPQLGVSQLSDSQAQLALAITSLLRSNNPLPSMQQPPSLLNLPQVNNPGISDYRQQSYGRSNRPIDRRSRYSDSKSYGRRDDSRRNDSRKSSSGTNYRTTVTDKSSIKKTKDDESKNKNDSKTESSDAENIEKNDVNRDDAENEEENSNNKTEKKEVKSKDGKYSGIPVHFLKCIPCDKSMWDGESFEKHLRGRAHSLVFESLEDSYKIQADMLRQSIRLGEERKAIELNRMRRLGKQVDMRKGIHCNMCDYNFYGREAVHRKSDGHQKLKQFLHPRCKRCRLEFPTRIEWEEHRLTPEHLLKLLNSRENIESMGYEIDESEDCLLNTNGDEDEKESAEEGENIIFDVNDGTDFIDNFENRLPQLKKNRTIGASFISEVTGSFCKLCNRFFLTKETSELHTKSICHYEKYIQLLKKKHQEKKKEEESLENLIPEESKTEENVKREVDDDTHDDNEGNWKRRKTTSDSEENIEDTKSTTKTENLYDPMEADEEYQNKQNETTEKLTTKEVQIKQEKLSTPVKSGATIAEIVVEDLKDSEKSEDKESSPVAVEIKTETQTPKPKTRPRIGPLSKTRGNRSQ